MDIEIEFKNTSLEELGKLKSLIENKIKEKEAEQQRQKERLMIHTYRICLIENIKILLRCKPRITDKGELYSYIKNFIESTDKQEWVKEYFVPTMAVINTELCNHFKLRLYELLNEHDTYMLLCDFKTELSKVEL